MFMQLIGKRRFHLNLVRVLFILCYLFIRSNLWWRSFDLREVSLCNVSKKRQHALC